MSEYTNATARERLEALTGEWTMEAGPPGGCPGQVGDGSASSGSTACPC